MQGARMVRFRFARMMTRARIAAGLCVLLVSQAAAQVPAVDWKKQEAEILRHHRSLVQIDSSSPPGNETKVVDYLKKIFEAEGIPVKTIRAAARRARISWRV